MKHAFITSTNNISKIELLHRVRNILNELEKTTFYSKFLGEEVKDFECMLVEINEQYANLVDNYMAASFHRRNFRLTGKAK